MPEGKFAFIERLAARLPEQAGPGDVLVATTYWTYVGGGTHPAETAFTHLVDGTGQRWAQDDGFALSRAEWRPGETLLQWYRIALPADLPPAECVGPRAKGRRLQQPDGAANPMESRRSFRHLVAPSFRRNG